MLSSVYYGVTPSLHQGPTLVAASPTTVLSTTSLVGDEVLAGDLAERHVQTTLLPLKTLVSESSLPHSFSLTYCLVTSFSPDPQPHTVALALPNASPLGQAILPSPVSDLVQSILAGARVPDFSPW